MSKQEEIVVKNIMQIRQSKRLTQKDVGEGIGLTEATFNRIESNKIALSYEHLTLIASYFNMREIDINPETYAPSKSLQSMKVIVQLELKREKKKQVMKLVFGENNLTLLN
jgi:transcriptional regulator with XRE-family HTH domain